jgi:hypothetical protein
VVGRLSDRRMQPIDRIWSESSAVRRVVSRRSRRPIVRRNGKLMHNTPRRFAVMSEFRTGFDLTQSSFDGITQEFGA